MAHHAPRLAKSGRDVQQCAQTVRVLISDASFLHMCCDLLCKAYYCLETILISLTSYTSYQYCAYLIFLLFLAQLNSLSLTSSISHKIHGYLVTLLIPSDSNPPYFLLCFLLLLTNVHFLHLFPLPSTWINDLLPC